MSIEYEDSYFSGFSTFHKLVAEGSIESIKKELSNAPDIESRTTGATAFTPLCLAICRGRKDVVSLLIAHRAELNAKGINHGQLPLHLAVCGGSPEMVSILLEAKADPTLKNEEGHTAKQLAEEENDKKLIALFEAFEAFEIPVAPPAPSPFVDRNVASNATNTMNAAQQQEAGDQKQN